MHAFEHLHTSYALLVPPTYAHKAATMCPGSSVMPELRILVADDDRDVAENICEELEALGHTVVAIAKNGDEAVRFAQRYEPDLVIMDIKMPVVDGLVASKELMAAHPVPIILLTSYSDPDWIAEADAIGVQAYLVKPAESSELRPAIQLALSRFRQFQMLQAIAHTDELTGLANRRALMDEVGGILANAERHGFAVSLVLLDLDGFKAINDLLGHEAGDEALRAVAEALRGAGREGDRAYRLGGDEFVLLLPHTDGRGANRAAQRYRAAIRTIPLPRGMRLDASLGIATFPTDGTVPGDLLNLADSRMYTQKHAKPDRLPTAAHHRGSSSA